MYLKIMALRRPHQIYSGRKNHQGHVRPIVFPIERRQRVESTSTAAVQGTGALGGCRPVAMASLDSTQSV